MGGKILEAERKLGNYSEKKHLFISWIFSNLGVSLLAALLFKTLE